MNDILFCCLRDECNEADLIKVTGGYICSNTDCIHSIRENGFPVVNDLPILISELRTNTVCGMEAGKTYVERPHSSSSYIKRLIVGESMVTKENCEIFAGFLNEFIENPTVLVVGGGEKGFGTSALWDSTNIEILSFDIYASNTTDMVGDAHYMPIKSGTFDGVWIQAVLEHVVEPARVVSEIYRVLKTDGIVYAETPFMQQVH